MNAAVKDPYPAQRRDRLRIAREESTAPAAQDSDFLLSLH